MKAIAPLVLGLALLIGHPLRAQDPLVRQEQKQEGIRDATARASEQLEQLVAEFDRNGIEGQDVDILRSIQTVLGRLSTDQMQKIVDLLQDARENTDPAGGSNRLIGAFTNQKAVIVQLRQVLLEYQRQLALHQLARLFRELGDRQSANLHEALAVVATGRDKSVFRDADKLSLQMQEAEQISLRDEAGAILGRLEALAGATAEGLDNRASEGMRFATGRKLPESLAAASSDLGEQKPMGAATHEKAARDTLWELAAMLEAEKDTAEKLLEAVAEIEELIAGEKDVIESTEQLKMDPKAAAERTLERDPKVRRAREELARAEAQKGELRQDEKITQATESLAQTLEEARARQQVATPEETRERSVASARKDQAELVDKADFLQRRIESIAAEPSALLEDSIADMQAAREELGRDTQPENKIAPALAAEKDALAHLEAAREALLEQLTDTDLVEAVPDTKKEQLEELLDKVRDLKHEEEALMATAEKAEASNDPDALNAQSAPQADLENQTRQTQQAAAELAPEAASDLAEAAEMMDASAQALEGGDNAPDAQQAAVDALAEAEQKIEEQIGDLKAAEAELAELNDLMDKLNPIIEKQRDLQSDTNRESARPEPNASANEDLAGEQGALREETSALAQEVAESSVPQAAENLSDAAQNEQAAKDDLAGNNPEAAQPDQTQALENLNAAKGALEERMQELAQALGESPEPAADFAAAQAAIAMAQEQVAEAMSHLESPASLAEQLADRQEALAENIASQSQAAAQGQPQNPESSPLAQAEAAAAQAAGQLAEGDMQAAIGEMQKAQAALGQAQTPGQPPSPAGEAAPSVPELAREQAAVQALAEQLAAANTAAATEPLASASDAISPFSSESQGALPPSAQAALEAAQGALAEAGSEAAANSPQPAQANAEAAQNALADAAAALALAEAGLGAPSMASAPSPSKGQGQSPGQTPGQTPGQGQQPGQTPAPPSTAPSSGNLGNWTGTGAENGERRAATGTSGFIGLPKRERGTIRQSSSDSYPAEYGAQIEQYLKNLADQASGK